MSSAIATPACASCFSSLRCRFSASSSFARRAPRSPVWSLASNDFISKSPSADTARAAFASSESTTSWPSLIALSFDPGGAGGTCCEDAAAAAVAAGAAAGAGALGAGLSGTCTWYRFSGICFSIGCKTNRGGDEARLRFSVTIASRALLLCPDIFANSSSVMYFVDACGFAAFEASSSVPSTFTANFSDGSTVLLLSIDRVSASESLSDLPPTPLSFEDNELSASSETTTM